MPSVVCIETCTVPGRGLVEEGDTYEVDVIDAKEHLFLKFFSYKGVPIPEYVETKKSAPKKAAKEEPETEEEEKKEPEGDVFPKHTGGSYFELSDGTKVQGKEAAIEAEKALAASA